jgi:hypothetical protein
MLRKVTTGAFVALALVALSATRAAAQNPYSIEGPNVAHVTDTDNSGLAGGYSVPPCDSPSPQACKQNDPFGTKELSPINGSTTKIGPINTDALPTLGPTTQAPKTDLNTSWVQSKVTGDGHIWLYFGWRRQTANGSGFISIEIEKAAAGGPAGGCNYDTATEAQLTANCNPWAGRQDGDFILLWDQQGNSSHDIILRRFSGPLGFGQTLGLGAPETLPANVAFAEYCADFFCGETAVDLTAAGLIGGSGCTSFSNIIPGTVTGNSDSADYKDVVLAPFPTISNCGTVNVTKVTLDANGDPFPSGTGTFRYTLDRVGGEDIRYSVVTPPGCATPACDETLKLSIRTLTANGATETHSSLIQGTNYRLTENVSAAVLGSEWSFVGIVCVVDGLRFPALPTQYGINGQTFSVLVGDHTDCTITNKLVKTTPTFASIQTAKLFDTVTITNAQGHTPTGNITISMWSDSTCTTPLGSVSVSLDSAGTGSTLSNSGTISVSVGTNNSPRYWAVEYGGDAFNNALTKQATCNFESVLVTFAPAQ